MAISNNQILEDFRAFIIEFDYEKERVEFFGEQSDQLIDEQWAREFIAKHCTPLNDEMPKDRTLLPTNEGKMELSDWESIRDYLQQLANIPEQIARRAANLSEQTLNDCKRIAELSPVAAMAPSDPYRFQLPLAMYFRKTNCLSEEVVALWGQATLSFQRRPTGLRLMLQSQPDDWGLIVSMGEEYVISLCQDKIVETILCGAEQLDNHKIGIVPFRQATP